MVWDKGNQGPSMSHSHPWSQRLNKISVKIHFHLHYRGFAYIQLFSKWKNTVHGLMSKRAASKYTQWQEDTEPWGVLSSWQEARPRVTHTGTSLLSARGTAVRWPVPWEVGSASALTSEGLPVLELPAFPPVSPTSTAGCCAPFLTNTNLLEP